MRFDYIPKQCDKCGNGGITEIVGTSKIWKYLETLSPAILHIDYLNSEIDCTMIDGIVLINAFGEIMVK